LAAGFALSAALTALAMSLVYTRLAVRLCYFDKATAAFARPTPMLTDLIEAEGGIWIRNANVVIHAVRPDRDIGRGYIGDGPRASPLHRSASS